jgi:hypothetical protein
MFTVQVAAPFGARVMLSQPDELLEKMLPSPGNSVCLTRSATAAPAGTVSGGQITG